MMTRAELEKMNSTEIRKVASQMGIKNYVKFKKAELIIMISSVKEKVEKVEKVEKPVKEIEVPNVVGTITDTVSDEVVTEEIEEIEEIEVEKSLENQMLEDLAEAEVASKSAKIRCLLNKGWTRAKIAKAMGCRYQFVREIHVRMLAKENSN